MDVRAELAALKAQLLANPPADEPQSNAARQKSFKQRRSARKKQNIAILDMETDPFNNVTKEKILPYLAVLYSDEFKPIIIWEEDYDTFVYLVLTAIEGLSDSFTIFAHNGGKFDFMFLVHKLRGEVSFKGRGIMRATVGRHELRDSFHIIPERLANLKKQDFDYSTLTRGNRDKHKAAIIAYCISDCANLLYFVKKFIAKFGFKISVGAAAMAKVSEHYRVEKVAPIIDTKLRSFFFGGRVECIAGAGYFNGDFKLYDVNSMYPHVMASFLHPVGSEYVFRDGKPNAHTCFIRVACENNGALLARTETGDLSSNIRSGEFFTSKFEYETALELGLIWNVKILECVDNFNLTKFDKFVLPLYGQRAEEKTLLGTLTKGSEAHEQCKSEILFLKLILNNAYGKFAQNPRRYKEHFISDPAIAPPNQIEGQEYSIEYTGSDYWIWSRPSPSLRFNNVGTSASITGGARAILMRAINASRNPIYCDTDSLICEELRDHDLHASRLGAWDLEKEISELIVVGKKMYAYKDKAGEATIRSKGVAGLDWQAMLGLLQENSEIVLTNKGPTLTRHGGQSYISRRIRRTTPLASSRMKGSHNDHVAIA